MNIPTEDRTGTFRAALREVTDCSVGRIAEAARYGRSTFEVYLNRKPPSLAACRALARVLRERADRLQEHAERLEALGDEEAT